MNPHLQFNSSSKVLVRMPNWFGDIAMSTGFCRALLDMLEPHQAQMDLLIFPAYSKFLLPHNGKVIILDRNQNSDYAFGKTLRNKGYSHFFILPPSFSAALMAYASKIPYRIGYADDRRSWLLNPACQYIDKRKVLAYIEYLHILDKADEYEKYKPSVPLSIEEANAMLPKAWRTTYQDAIILAPFTAHGPAKEWFLHRYVALAAKLAKQGEKVVFIGGRHETPPLPSGVYNLCGETSLLQLIALIRKSKLLISNDSGTLHLTSAIGRPQIAIYGSTTPIWTPPINDKAIILRYPISCSPCFKKHCPLGHYHCLANISFDEVYQSVCHFLK